MLTAIFFFKVSTIWIKVHLQFYFQPYACECGGRRWGDLILSVELGVKQGCVMAPVLFNLYLAAAIELFHDRIPTGHGLTSTTDWTVVSSICSRTMKLWTSIWRWLRLGLWLPIKPLGCFKHYDIYCSLSLSIAVTASKTELIYQWTEVEPAVVPVVTLGDNELKVSSQFNYLGSVFVDNSPQTLRLTGELTELRFLSEEYVRGWSKTTIQISVYRALCLSVLLSECETLTLYVQETRQAFWDFPYALYQDSLGPKLDILERADISRIECTLLGRQMRWAGHVLCVPESRLPRRVLYGQLSTGTRARGGPKNRYKDKLTDRSEWRTVCHRGALHFEANLIRQRNDRRRWRQESALQPPPPSTSRPRLKVHWLWTPVWVTK